jgi:hypothetical protein
VSVDSNGDGYRVGDRIVLPGSQLGGTNGVNSLTVTVTSVTNTNDFVGGVATVDIVSGAASGSGSNSFIQDNYDNGEGEVKTMAFDPVTGDIVIVVTTPTYNGDTFDNEWTETVVMRIDSGSGAVVSTTTLASDGDVYANDVAVSVTGKTAVAGVQYNVYKEYGAITPLTGSGLDVLWVAKADIDAEHFPGEEYSNTGDWWIYGSTILDQASVMDLNQYSGLTGATRPGSGATFDIIDNGNGSYSAGVVNGGTNYRAGHKIKILGTALGGATPANDITITVQTVNGSGVIQGGGVGNSGTAAGTETATYTGLSGTNIDLGSGAVFSINFNPTTGAILGQQASNTGANYVEGDVITILGTSFAGGTAPTNNITITVNSVDSGAITGFTPTGTHPSTHLRIATDYSVDFADVEATFFIKQNLGGEAFVWTPDWNKAIGGGNTDEFNGVVWNAAGTHLYAVGNGRYEVNYQQALVVKYSSTGTLVASKYINGDMNTQSADQGAVALMANDSIVTVHEQYNSERDETNEVLVTKLDSNLNILWQHFIGWYTGDAWDSPYSDISVAVDPATDEILLAWCSNEDSINGGDDAIIIVKLDTDGQVLWKRLLSVYESDVNFAWSGGSKGISIHGNQFTIVGNTDAPSDNTENAYIVTLPLDGTGTGLHGIWAYTNLNDTRVRVQRTTTTATVFTPGVNNNTISAEDNIKYYYADYPQRDFTYYPNVIRSNEGGAVEFADGSKQTFSTAIIPQVRIGENRYTLRAEDSGRHILVDKEYNYDIIIPNWQRTTLPIGYTVTIINTTNETINIQTESVDWGWRGEIWFSGGDDKTPRVGISDNGSGQMVTLIKIKEGTTSDEGDNHGDIWMIAGADIYNND